MNKLEKLRLVELMCKSIISSIELHRIGIEKFEDVMNRIGRLFNFLEMGRNIGLRELEEDLK